MAVSARASALLRTLEAPVDIASLALVRVALGVLLCVSTLRFLFNGWVERFFVTPHYFFSYSGFEWVEPLSHQGMLFIHWVMAAAAFLVALGLLYRVAIVVLFLTFTYVELIDVTNYLNHYYLVSLLLLLCCFLPLSGTASIDAVLFPTRNTTTVPRWVVWLFRAQISIVYLGAAIAKANTDWLYHAQPLGIWLASRGETPVLGPLLAYPWAPYLFAWAGFLHDLLAPAALLSRRTRGFAYPIILGFHLGTHLLFNIGIFPFLMPIMATVFFAPDWPRRFVPSGRAPPAGIRAVKSKPWRVRFWGAAVFLVIQTALPLRAQLYSGNVLWTEQGMRFSWRVMVREKNGAITYRVSTDEWTGEKEVPPSRYLTPHQEREFSGQPDMIAQLARRIAKDYRERGFHGVEVRVDAWVSLNGRPSARLIDPSADLGRAPSSWGEATWILAAPRLPPLPATPR